MKTLILNGSPRKNGDTVTLIEEVKKYLPGDIKVVNAYDDNILPCVDCRFCWENDGCVVKDDMEEIYKYLEDADNVIIASPIYFSELTGKLLDVVSRLQIYYVEKFVKHKTIFPCKKRGMLIITAGGNPAKTNGENTASIIFGLLNVESVGTVRALETDLKPASENLKAMEDIKNYVDMLKQFSKNKEENR